MGTRFLAERGETKLPGRCPICPT